MSRSFRGRLVAALATLLGASSAQAGVISFADTGFESTTGFSAGGIGTNGPWEIARLALLTGNTADLTFGIASSQVFTDAALPGGTKTTTGNGGKFMLIEDTAGGGDSRAVAFVGQHITIPQTVTAVSISLDDQKFAKQTDRSTRIGLALFTATNWAARRPDQPLMQIGDNTTATGYGALWSNTLSENNAADDLTWTPRTSNNDSGLISALNANLNKDLVLAFYGVDFWAPDTQTFSYVDNFQATITTVPEPTTALLLGVAALLLPARRRPGRR